MIDLVIFTCQGREHLLQKTLNSFTKFCDYPFNRIILAIDGEFNEEAFSQVKPDIIIKHSPRRGYVNSISKALKLIEAPYFFWLEDDWLFHQKFDLPYQLGLLQANPGWCEVLFSKWTPMEAELKVHPVGEQLYETTFGFSANPCLCNSAYLQSGFAALQNAPKGGQLGEDGFENFLTRHFAANGLKSVIIDPGDNVMLSHEGYLESTPRNWHMTNSLEEKTREHLLVIPVPPLWRRLQMLLKLAGAFTVLSVKQLVNNEAYEFCFRIIANLKSMRKNG